MKLRLHAQALADLDEAAIWYDDQQPGLGDEFLAEVGKHFSLLVESPGVWPLWPDARRRQHPVRRLRGTEIEVLVARLCNEIGRQQRMRRNQNAWGSPS